MWFSRFSCVYYVDKRLWTKIEMCCSLSALFLLDEWSFCFYHCIRDRFTIRGCSRLQRFTRLKNGSKFPVAFLPCGSFRHSAASCRASLISTSSVHLIRFFEHARPPFSLHPGPYRNDSSRIHASPTQQHHPRLVLESRIPEDRGSHEQRDLLQPAVRPASSRKPSTLFTFLW